MITKKRTIGLVLICLLTVGITSVYAAGGNPFDTLTGAFEDFQIQFQEMWSSITGLEADVAAIEENMYLHLEIAQLTARVAALEGGGSGSEPPGPPEPPEPLNSTGLGLLIYDSGWLSIDPGQDQPLCILDDPNVFVYLTGQIGSLKAHQIDDNGVWWAIDEWNQLLIHRELDDTKFQRVRVMVWQLPPSPT